MRCASYEISNNVVCVTSKGSDQTAHMHSLIRALASRLNILYIKYSMSIKLMTEHYLEFLSLKGGYTGSSESTLVKMPHCWKSRVTAQLQLDYQNHLDLILLYLQFFLQTIVLHHICVHKSGALL